MGLTLTQEIKQTSIQFKKPVFNLTTSTFVSTKQRNQQQQMQQHSSVAQNSSESDVEKTNCST